MADECVSMAGNAICITVPFMEAEQCNGSSEGVTVPRGREHAKEICPAGGATTRESASLGLWEESLLAGHQSERRKRAVTSLWSLGVATEETRARSSKMAGTEVSRSVEAIACIDGELAERTESQNPTL